MSDAVTYTLPTRSALAIVLQAAHECQKSIVIFLSVCDSASQDRKTAANISGYECIHKTRTRKGTKYTLHTDAFIAITQWRPAG